jgi:hypothetical protein
MEVPMRTILSTFLATIVLLVSSIALASAAAPVKDDDNWFLLEDDFTTCTGESIFVTGGQHVFEQIFKEDGDQQHFIFHRNTFGTGVSTVSGDKYMLQDTVTKVDLIGTTEGDTTVFVQFSELTFIQKGETTQRDDLHVLMLSRYTITPDDTRTGEIELVSAICR